MYTTLYTIHTRWLRDLFEEADKNGDGTLDMKEVLRIMQQLNIGISKKVLKQKFKVSHVMSCDGHVVVM